MQTAESMKNLRLVSEDKTFAYLIVGIDASIYLLPNAVTLFCGCQFRRNGFILCDRRDEIRENAFLIDVFSPFNENELDSTIFN